MPAPNKHRQRQAGELRVITCAKELEYHTYNKCRNGKVFPKKDRMFLPARMMDEASNACAFIQDANSMDIGRLREGGRRLDLQRDAMRELRKLLNHIELAKRLKLINEDECAYWAKLASNVLYQTAAWHKSDKRRHAAALDEKRRNQACNTDR